MAPRLDMDDFDSILACTDVALAAPGASVPSNGNGSSGAPALIATEDNWQNDPIPTKLDKIRAAFLNAKSPTEVQTAAWLMPIGDWLEMVVKLSPKNVQVTGDISFIHMLDTLGPINKSEYRLPTPAECIVEAELAE